MREEGEREGRDANEEEGKVKRVGVQVREEGEKRKGGSASGGGGREKRGGGCE